MTPELLVNISQKIGLRIPGWVQGAGGNASLKVVVQGQRRLLIKPSGRRMGQIKTVSDLVPVDLDVFNKGLKAAQLKNNEEMYSQTLGLANLSVDKKVRPSMETGFHAVLPGKMVLHFHSLAALLMGFEHGRNFQKMNAWLTKNWGLPFEFVEACSPGLGLTHIIETKKNASLFILKNHGVILQDEDGSLLSKWEILEETFCRDWGYDRIAQMNRPLDVESVWKKEWMRRAIPLKIYFPDMAVFVAKLKPFLEAAGETSFRLKPEAWKESADLGEIWFSTQLLYDACPELSELPSLMADVINNLPTERFRKASHE